MQYIEKLINPISILFAILLIGLLIGKIKTFDLSLDLASVLIVAIITGVMLSRYFPSTISSLDFAMSVFSQIGTAIFVSVIALSAGMSLTNHSKKESIISFISGATTVLIGFLITRLIYLFDAGIDKGLLLGIFCGAMTSTPALATICESGEISAELATLGYGISYLFGVISVVIFVQSFSEKSEKEVHSPRKEYSNTGWECDCLLCISTVSLSGYILHAINNTLSISGCILLCGIIVGRLLGTRSTIKQKLSVYLPTYRNIGLLLFFVGNGITAGRQFNTELVFKWLLYGILISAGAIICGNIVSRIFLKKNLSARMCIIAGGMTSTPALSVLIRKSNDNINATAYSFSYLGALLTITLGIRFIL